MTLEEAIKHCEEVAKTCEMEVLERSNLPLSVVGYEDAKKRDLDRKRECASEHRQLAEWLKRLKRIEDYIADGKDDMECTYSLCFWEIEAVMNGEI